MSVPIDEQLSSDETLRAALTSAGSSEFRSRLLKDVILGGVALLCLFGFIYWPHSWVVICGVAVIVFVAYLSEMRSKGRRTRWPASRRSVVITGCDTGFGHHLAKHLDQLGATVFAGCLDASGAGATTLRDVGSDRLHVLQMDVTDAEQIAKCVDYVMKEMKNSGVWGLVNNSGVNFLGDIELTTMEQFKRIADINQLGMVHVTKAFLPAIRHRRGRIVNITSVKGRVAEPMNAAYAMSKHAAEAFSDILRMEMKKFDVKVSIIEPGKFGGATESLNMDRIRNDFEVMWAELSAEQHKMYGRGYIDHHFKHIDAVRPTSSVSLVPVMDAITDALFAMTPRTRYLVPGGNAKYDPYKWRILVQPFLPTWFLDWWFLADTRDFPRPVVDCCELKTE